MIKYQVEPTNGSIKIIDWENTGAIFTNWVSIGEPYGCSYWTPDESTIPNGQSFIQERDCSINQERIRQDRQLSSNGKYKDIGEPTLESRVETVLQSRNSNGLMESWVAIGATYTEWVNVGLKYDCTWTPDVSTIDSGTSFIQNGSSCKQNQTRNGQNREQETYTSLIRDVGDSFLENNTLTGQTDSRDAIGTKVNKVCLYDLSFSWFSGAFLISQYSTIPSMWIETANGTDAWWYTPVAGLSKINSYHFTYNDGSKIWNITRGALMAQDSWQVCFE